MESVYEIVTTEYKPDLVDFKPGLSIEYVYKDVNETTEAPKQKKQTPKRKNPKTAAKKCPKCKKVFAREENKRDHVKICNFEIDRSAFICNLCNNNYNYYSNLKRHKVKCIQELVDRKSLVFSDKLNTLTVDKREFEALWNKADKIKRDFFGFFEEHEEEQKRTRPYFIYALVDPRTWVKYGDEDDQWISFLKSIFYIGVGHAQNQHEALMNALQIYRTEDDTPAMIVTDSKPTDKDYNITQIWKGGRGILMPVLYPIYIPLADQEALTIEACLIKALGIENLTNTDEGSLYGPAAIWSDSQQECFGVIHLKELYMITRTSVEIYPDYIDFILD